MKIEPLWECGLTWADSNVAYFWKCDHRRNFLTRASNNAMTKKVAIVKITPALIKAVVVIAIDPVVQRVDAS